MLKYYNLEVEKVEKITCSSLQLKLRVLRPEDISLVMDYLTNSKVSKYMNNRYFSSWKFYKFEITYSSLISLLCNKKLLIVVDEINKIYGILIIDLIKSTDIFHKKPLIQIDYFDCKDYYIYLEVINLLISAYSNKCQYSNIQFFLPKFIDLSNHLSNNSSNYFEQFLIYYKKLQACF